MWARPWSTGAGAITSSSVSTRRERSATRHVVGSHAATKRSTQQSASIHIEKSSTSDGAARIDGSASWSVAEDLDAAGEVGREAAAVVCGSRSSPRAGPSAEEKGSPVASPRSAAKHTDAAREVGRGAAVVVCGSRSGPRAGPSAKDKGSPVASPPHRHLRANQLRTA